MKVILLEEVEGLGKPLDIVEVSAGYGRNFLIPRKLAREVNPVSLNWRNQRLRAMEEEKRRTIEVAYQLVRKLDEQILRIPVQVGADGKIFGSVTTLTLVQAIKQQLGFEVDRRTLTLLEEVKRVGTYQAKILLPDGKEHTFVFEVVPEV